MPRPSLDSFVGTTRPTLDSFSQPSPQTPVNHLNGFSVMDSPDTTGAGSAYMPATPASDKGYSAPLEVGKMIPNALSDVLSLIKQGTYGTAKNILYEIPKAVSGLMSESQPQNLLTPYAQSKLTSQQRQTINAPKTSVGATTQGFSTFIESLPGGIKDVLSSIIPNSAKNLANIQGLEQIPQQFQNLAKESGGYWNATKAVAENMPGATPQGIANYVQNIDKARQSFQNHPANELLGYMALKQLVENPKQFAQQTSDALMKTKEFVTSPKQSLIGVGQDLYKAISSNDPQKIDNFINTQYQKGVRPTVAGKNTLGQVERANNNQLTAVRTIVENKPNLNIVDQYGDPTGRVPETLNQFSQGIEQTRSQIFKQYDALQKQAGQAGAVVDLKPVANELNVVSSDKVLNDLHPEIAKYAQDRATAFNARGIYNAEEAQNAIKILNKSLDAFYKNPSYETASKASIDSMVVNKLREGLDTTIENNASPGYQDLKNKYGALKSIEKDVIHRAIVDGRKNTKGLLDFTDIASGAELVRGLLTMNPVDLAASATIKGISMYQKYLNNPNTAIKRLFQAAEKN